MRRTVERIILGRGKYVLAPSLAALAFVGTGCGDNEGSKTTKSKTSTAAEIRERPAPTGQTGAELAASIARTSKDVEGDKTVPATFCKNTDQNPQAVYSQNPARLIVNTLCQPPLGKPASLYEEPSFESEKVGKVEDGDVVDAICIDPNGQSTTNVDHKGSDTWVKISSEGETGFISEVNLAFVRDADFERC